MTTQMTTDELLALVERSGLLDAEALKPYRASATTSADLANPEALARAMVRDRVLTPFQARHLLRGRHRGFFLSEKFKVLEHLGEGGMGRVLLCEHLVLHKLVAVKLLNIAGAGAGAAERFLREARASAAIDHPNIVRVFDLERAGAVPFMVMEYVDGTNLHQLVASHGPLDANRAAEYCRQSALGLEQARLAGLVHRDVKPGNILLDRSGNIKLLDLGLARFFDPDKNRDITQKFDESSVLGTADFIAPEQAMNSSQVDIRADIYSLGCTLYYLLSGRFPFEGGAVTQKLVWHQLREPEALAGLRPGLPEGLVEAVTRMMKKAPADRYQTPAEVALALAPCSAGVVPPVPAEMPRMRPSIYRIGLCEPPSARLFAQVDPSRRSSGDIALEPTTTSLNSSLSRRSLGGADIATPTLTGRTLAGDPTRSYASGVHPRRRWAPLAAAAGGLLAAVAIGVAVLTLGGRENADGPAPGTSRSALGAAGGAAVTVNPSQLPTPAVTPAFAGKTLAGAGSTFVEPLMQHWSGLYEARAGVRVQYGGGGSGAGVKNMVSQANLFGCTDAPMTEAELTNARKLNGPVIHVPLALGAVVPVYNLPGLARPIRFTGPVLADIYLGKIKRWNDAPLAVSNPGLDLPDLAITVVHRSDKSGTTFIWTDYLKKTSAEWNSRIGAGTEVKWPVGDEGKGNDGVATAVSRQNGALGYVELGYALANSLPYGHVKNRTGVFIEPTLESVTAAAAANLPNIEDDLRYSLTDAPGAAAYPICGTVWAVAYTDQRAEEGRVLAEFLWWATHDGQGEAKKLRYSPIPGELMPRIESKLRSISGSGL